MEDKWLREIRESLSDFETTPPEGLRESLDIDGNPSADIIRRKVPHIIGRLRSWMVAAASIILFGVGIVVFLRLERNVDLDLSVPENFSDNLQTQSTGPDKPSNLMSAGVIAIGIEGSNSAQGNRCPTIRGTNLVAHNDISNSETIETDSTYIENALEDADSKDAETGVAEEPNADKEKVSSSASPEHYNMRSPFVPPVSIRSSSTANYSIGLVASGSVGTSGNSRNIMAKPGNNGTDLQPPYPGDQNPDDSNGFPDSSIFPDSPEDPSDAYIEEISETTFHQPVRLGLTVEYYFNDRIGLETGILYTRLTSRTVTVTGSSHSDLDRTLHYIGIPVNFKYRGFTWKSLDLYLSAGLTAEKCFSNKISSRIFTDGHPDKINRDDNKRPFQFSTTAALGIQFRLVSSIAIFTEPGISYYCNDGTAIPTLYKEKPCNFTFTLGLRLIMGSK